MGMSLANIMNRTEVAVFGMNLTDIRDTYAEILEAQAEVGGMVTYRAKVATGGGKAFDIVTGDEETDTSVSSFSGVIVYNHNCNAYFDEDATGNTPPVCSSMDGVIGFDAETGEPVACKNCPRNAYGTAKNGRGKACKNMHRLFIMVEDVPIPTLLTLPPTSLTAFQNYRTKVLAAKKFKPNEVVTEFSLTSAQSQTGQKYSVVKFRLLGKLASDQAEVARYFTEQLKAAASRASEMTGEDYNRGGSDGN